VEKDKEDSIIVYSFKLMYWVNFFNYNVLAADHENNTLRDHQMIDLANRVYKILWDCYAKNKNNIIILDGHGRTIWTIFNVWKLFFEKAMELPEITVYEVDFWSQKYHNIYFPIDVKKVEGNILNQRVINSQSILFLNFCVIKPKYITQLYELLEKSDCKKFNIYITSMMRKWNQKTENGLKRKRFVFILSLIGEFVSFRNPQMYTIKINTTNKKVKEILKIWKEKKCDKINPYPILKLMKNKNKNKRKRVNNKNCRKKKVRKSK
jgi:hypothetical protein